MACSVLPAPFEQPSARHRLIVVSDMLESNAFVGDSEFIFILRLANTLCDVRVLDLYPLRSTVTLLRMLNRPLSRQNYDRTPL